MKNTRHYPSDGSFCNSSFSFLWLKSFHSCQCNMRLFLLSIQIAFLRTISCDSSSDPSISSTIKSVANDAISLTIPPERNMREEMIKANVIPDILDDAPIKPMRVRYGFEGVNFGDHLNRIQLKKMPSFVNWEKKFGHFYTLIMTGLDAPTMKNPGFREFQHWIVTNIPARIIGIVEGDTLTEYKLENDFLEAGYYGDGNHRIAYLMFEQPSLEKIIFKEHRIHTGSNDSLRTNFSSKTFAAKHKLKIVGFNWVTLDFKKFDTPIEIDWHAVTPAPFG